MQSGSSPRAPRQRTIACACAWPDFAARANSVPAAALVSGTPRPFAYIQPKLN